MHARHQGRLRRLGRELGYPFVAALDFRRFTYVWCRNTPPQSERGQALAFVRLDRACLAAKGKALGTGYVDVPGRRPDADASAVAPARRAAALPFARACCLLRCLWRCVASPGSVDRLRRGGSGRPLARVGEDRDRDAGDQDDRRRRRSGPPATSSGRRCPAPASWSCAGWAVDAGRRRRAEGRRLLRARRRGERQRERRHHDRAPRAPRIAAECNRGRAVAEASRSPRGTLAMRMPPKPRQIQIEQRSRARRDAAARDALRRGARARAEVQGRRAGDPRRPRRRALRRRRRRARTSARDRRRPPAGAHAAAPHGRRVARARRAPRPTTSRRPSSASARRRRPTASCCCCGSWAWSPRRRARPGTDASAASC